MKNNKILYKNIKKLLESIKKSKLICTLWFKVIEKEELEYKNGEKKPMIFIQIFIVYISYIKIHIKLIKQRGLLFGNTKKS